MLGYCSLQASAATVVRGRAVHLAERGGGRGLEREILEPALPVRPQLGGHAPPHERPAHGRRLGLQLRELGGVLLGQGLGNRRQQLRDLHQRALQPAQRRPQLLGVAWLIDVDAEQALTGEARRQPAHGARYLGVAPHPPAERVLRLSVSHALVTHAGQLGVQLVDQRLDDAKAAAPEAGVARIEAERRQQLLVAKRAAGLEQLQIALLEALRVGLVDRVQRVHQAVAEGIGVDVERHVDEVRDVAPEHAVGVVEAEGGAEALGLHVEPDLAELVGGQLRLLAGIVHPALELDEGDLPHHGVERVLDLAGQQDPALHRIALGREQRAEGQLLAEHRGGLGERQRRRRHQRPLPAGQHLVHAVAQLVRERHDVARAPLVVHQHVGVHARHGRMAERAGILARPQGGVDPALAEEALEDRREPRREAAIGVEHDDLGIRPGDPLVAVLGQRRVAIPVLEMVEPEPARLQRVVAVRQAGIGVADRRDQRVDHLVLDVIGEVAARDRPRELAPAVLDLLVLGERVGDQREQPDPGRRAPRRSRSRRPAAWRGRGPRAGRRPRCW